MAEGVEISPLNIMGCLSLEVRSVISASITYLSGCEDYADMALFVRHRAREFGLFPYTDRNPSSDTFERLFAILRTEIDKGGHYFLAVKENQAGLLAEMRDVMRYNKPVSTCSSTENVSDGGREESQTAYFISDEDFASAGYYGALCRGHWAVENGPHWHLDVTFREDDCRARRDNAARNLSLIRKIALQVAKATNDRLSVRKRLVRASMDSDYLMLLLKNYGFH